ncbi:14969_t:CDS:2 [Funneliformis geosporum]|uniref:5931_t:CDS:1 n=1 Tax=Funneliformis geosporum TaxID=1117311 RepID=A0A9W4SY69_9GLOM|nr:5931_t:CDS:2 [Funneliformis geosporum]CAI2185899.1 14969_t:CDS:2 [Funneliformis geosporum]
MKQIHDTYESANPFSNILTKEEIMREVAKAYGPPPKPQKPEKFKISLNEQSQKLFYCSNCEQEGHKKIIVST